MKKTGIYKITNIITEKIYVGSAIDINCRWRTHKHQLINYKHHSIKLQRSCNVHGFEYFKFEIIEECDKKLLIEREQYWIDTLSSYKNGYNSSPLAGSTLGFKSSEKSKLERSERMMGSGNYFFGKRHTKESIDSIKEKLSDSNKGEKNPFFGKTHTESVKEKLRRPLLEETKRKISQSKMGKSPWNKGLKGNQLKNYSISVENKTSEVIGSIPNNS